jgi:hypothetical protein
VLVIGNYVSEVGSVFSSQGPGSSPRLGRNPAQRDRATSSQLYVRLFIACCFILFFMPERWCTVTTTDAEGRRHSVDVQAASTFDAAHIYLTYAKAQPGAGIPPLTLATVFEVVIGGKVHTVAGAALQRWIIKERSERKGPRGLLFSRRATLD